MSIVEKQKQLKRMIRHVNKVFIVAHQDLDLDAIGSSLGMYEILRQHHKECYLVINDRKNELGVQKVLAKVKNKVNILRSTEVSDHLDEKDKKNLLLILDTNKTYLLPDEKLLTLFQKVIVIDHHETTEQSIAKGLIIIDTTVSSTCEMITQLLDGFKVTIDPFISTVLLSGIVLDTNNFMLKTTSKTYYTAYYLTKLGADPKKVQYLLKQDLKQYIERQKTITDVKILKQNIALAVSSPQIIYRREDLAKIADTLLLFNGIEASFVIGKISKTAIGISSRSMGHIPVQDILEQLGGGGDAYNAAAKIENSTLERVEVLLKKQIRLQRNEEK